MIQGKQCLVNYVGWLLYFWLTAPEQWIREPTTEVHKWLHDFNLGYLQLWHATGL